MKETLVQYIEEHWEDLGTQTFTEIGDKYFGDSVLFFAAGENLGVIGLENPRTTMTLLAAVAKIAYERGRRSMIQ